MEIFEICNTVITLTLLHPLQSVPVQSWSFESESLVRIGRSTDNDVVLYSAVVSRHHVELKVNDSGWQVISLGANGTYLDGKRITQVPVVDGMVIRLASSGPKIQIRIGSIPQEARLKTFSGKRSEAPKMNEPSKQAFLDTEPTTIEHRNEGDLRQPHD